MPETAPLKLTDFVDVSMLQSLQDGFAGLVGVSTSIRDAEGMPITRPAGESVFCGLMKSSETGRAACRASHVEAARRVQRSNEACESHCHAGLHQLVAPIVVQGQHLGTIIVGDRPMGFLPEEEIAELAGQHGLDRGELERAAGGLSPWVDDQMEAATSFVRQLADTLAQLCYQAYELRRRIDELAAVHEIAAKLSGQSNLQEMLDTVTSQLVETMGLRASAVRLLNEETGILHIASVANLSKAYLDKPPIPVNESPIDEEVLRGRTVYVEDLRTDPRTFYQEKAREEGLVSMLVTTMSHQGRPIGVIRAYMDRVHRFSPFDVSLLEAVASQAAGAITSARLHRDAAEADQLERQVKMAVDVQRRMIPAHPPASARYEFAAIYEPSSDLSGDFYDFIEFDNGDLGVMVADVVGKGVAASLTMASARSAMRSNARRVTDLSQIMRFVNRRLCHDNLPGEFATAFYCELAADGSKVRHSNGGHEPMLLLRGGVIRELDVGGLALGIDPDAVYEWAEESLERGDLLVLVTDGVLEAFNFDGEAFGRERMHASIRLHASMAPDMPTELIAKQLLWDVRRFVGFARMRDDITIVMARVR